MQPPEGNHLLFIGASARWASQSAVKAGYKVSAIDMFGDHDLREVLQWWASFEDTEERTQVARCWPPSRVIALGGIENDVSFLQEIDQHHQILGARPSVFSKLRDLEFVDQIAHSAGIRRPPRTSGPSRQSQWLLKSTTSAGGMQTTRYCAAEQIGASRYLEQWTLGRPIGCSFLATDRAVMQLGICAALRSRLPPRPFLYEGSLGPIQLPKQALSQLQAFGERTVAATGLRGLFGADFILMPNGNLSLLEINPRPTASMELLESGSSLIDLHVHACLGENASKPNEPSNCAGKRIFYARHQMKFCLQDFRRAVDRSIRFADFPVDGTWIPAGSPVCSLMTSGTTLQDVTVKLAIAARKLAASTTSGATTSVDELD